MKKRFHKRALPFLAGLSGIALVAAIAIPAVAFTTDDDHAVAERLVADLDHDSAHKLLTQDAVAHAKQALERSLRMRQAGDETRAREVDALARGWAELGRDL